MHTTKKCKEFVTAHARLGNNGWVCKETGARLENVTVQQVTGRPDIEPGGKGTRVIEVEHLWCPRHSEKPDVRKLTGTHIAEEDLVGVYSF